MVSTSEVSPFEATARQLEQLLQQAVNGLVGGLLTTAPTADQVTVERTRDAQHGDFATTSPCDWRKPRGAIRASWLWQSRRRCRPMN